MLGFSLKRSCLGSPGCISALRLGLLVTHDVQRSEILPCDIPWVNGEILPRFVLNAATSSHLGSERVVFSTSSRLVTFEVRLAIE